MKFKTADDSQAPVAPICFNKDGTIEGADSGGWLSLPGVADRLIINGENGPLVTIDLQTGEHIFAEGIDLDDAARTFWQYVSEYVIGERR